MPENWKTYKLEALAERVTVGFVGSMAQEYTEEGIPMLRSQNIKPFTLDYNNLKYISEKFHQKIIKSSLKKDDVAIVRTGNPGTACVIPEGLPALNCSDLVIVTPDKDKIDPHFLCFYFNSVAAQYVSSELVGAVQQHFNVSSAKKMKIRLPEIQEQISIVKVLKDIQDKIELNLQMNKTLEEMAMALYKHWFVDFGPFREGKFVDSELGMIPEGWEVKTIGELYNTTSGGTPSRKKPEYYIGGDIYWVKSKELYGNFIIDTEEKINHLGLKKSSAKVIPPKSVLLAMYGATVGESSILSIEATCNQAICAISKKELSFIYVFLYLRIFKTYILNQATGSAQQNISQQIIKNISIISPPVGLKVFEELEQYYALIEQNLFENQTLTSLRDTLLPRLISGEVRVKEAEKILTEAL